MTLVSVEIILPGLYISYIDPKVPDAVLPDLLALNDMGYGTRIKFDGHYPVYILSVDPENMMFGNAVAEAQATTFGCLIRLNSEAMYEASTIYHELLHCYGYKHVDNPFDIMYYSQTPLTMVETIRPYLKELQDLYE
jgi:hypothetical protein